MGGAFAFADPELTVSISTVSPSTLNTTTNLVVPFTLTASPFTGSENITLDFLIGDSTDPVTATLISSTTYATLGASCTGDLNTTSAACSYSFLPAGVSDGTNYVFVRATSGASIITSSASSAITFDSTNPVLSEIQYSPAPVSGWSHTSVIVSSTCTDATTCTMQYSLDNGSNFSTFSGNQSITSANGILVIKATDAAGNLAIPLTGVTLQIDATAPTGSVVSNPAPNGSGWIGDATPEFTLSASDTGGSGLNVSTFFFKIDGIIQAMTFTGNPIAFTPSANLAEGAHTVTLDINDTAGNALATVSYPISIDTIAPAVPSGFDNGTINSTDVILNWSISSDGSGSGVQNYQIYQSTGTDSSGANSIGTVTGTTLTANGLSACTTYSFWVKARDNVGNVSGFSSIKTITTTGCVNTNTNTNTNSDNGSGGGGGGGGSSSTACDITFAIPTNVYAGEIITAKATSSTNYTLGKFRVTPQGKATFYIVQSGGTAKQWEGSYTIPNDIGLSLAFRFGANECGTASTTRTIKDPATQSSGATTTGNSNPTSGNENNPAPALTAAPPASTVEPASANVEFSADKIADLLALAGFNADGEKTMGELLTQLKTAKTLKVVKNNLGKYEIHLILAFTNTANAGTLKVIESVPKSFAETADQMTANYEMTVLKDDPLVQFTLTDLTEGQTIAIELVSKTVYETAEAANAALPEIQGDATSPPLLFTSGTAAPAPGSGNFLAGFSGLASSATGAAPLVIGFLAVVGLIMVSVRVVRGSVEGSDNPILRSSSRAGNSNSERVVNSPIRGKKIWSSGEVRIGDDDE